MADRKLRLDVLDPSEFIWEEGPSVKGAYGQVRFAELDGTRVAVKTLLAGIEMNFLEEIKLAFAASWADYIANFDQGAIARVVNAGVFRVLGVDVEALVMEAYDGDLAGLLSSLRREGISLGLNNELLAVRDMISAVRVVHDLGVWIRDIKLKNFLYKFVGGRPRLFYGDFGFAIEEDRDFVNIVGSPSTMAPEIVYDSFVRGGRSTEDIKRFARGIGVDMTDDQLEFGKKNLRADLYSLGVVMFHLINLEHPYMGWIRAVFASNDDFNSLTVSCFSHLCVKPEKFKDPNHPLKPLIMKLLEKNPDDRYQTIDEVMADFERICSDLGVAL